MGRPGPILENCPAEAIDDPNGGDKYHVSPISAADFEAQKAQIQSKVLDRGPAVIDQSAQVRVGFQIGILGRHAVVEREEYLREVIEQEPRQRGRDDSGSDPQAPVLSPQWLLRAAPGQHTGPEASPRHTGDEQPQKPKGPRDGNEFAFAGIGLQVSQKEAWPLHPSPISRECKAKRQRRDDPT